MAKPVLLAIDDNVQVLSAVARDLRGHYGRDYRVLRADSGAAALDLLRELKERQEPVALVLSDQRMPGMDGVTLLSEVLTLHSKSKRALLTAYADTEAAIAAINRSQLDYYLLKPWNPPEERLYPILDELLDDWRASFRPGYAGVRVVGDHLHHSGFASYEIGEIRLRGGDRLKRARLLPAQAEIALAAGDKAAARLAASELEGIATDYGTTALLAAAEDAMGALALAEGSVADAVARLRNASRLWLDNQAPYEAARVRLRLAQALRARGTPATPRSRRRPRSRSSIGSELSPTPGTRRACWRSWARADSIASATRLT